MKCDFFDKVNDCLFENMFKIHIFTKILSYFIITCSCIDNNVSGGKICCVFFLLFINLRLLYRIAFENPGSIFPKTTSRYSLHATELMDGTIIYIDMDTGCRIVEIPHTSFDSPSTSADTNKSYNVYYQKYCLTCNIFRPPGLSHCSFCKTCILEKDHHCPSLRNCIGRNNYSYFLLFLKTDVLIGFIVFCFFCRLIRNNESTVVTSLSSYMFFSMIFDFIKKYYINIIFSAAICLILIVINIFNVFTFIKFHRFFIMDMKAREYILGLKKPSFDISSFFKRLSTIKSQIIEKTS